MTDTCQPRSRLTVDFRNLNVGGMTVPYPLVEKLRLCSAPATVYAKLALLTLLALFPSSALAQSSTHSGEYSMIDCENNLAAKWIADNFAGIPIVSGMFTGRQEVESPVWLKDVTISGARYGVSVHETKSPEDRRVAMTNLRVSNLRSKTRFGGGIKTHNSSRNMSLFLLDVTITPKWPNWISYENTNYDGIVLDGAAALYAQDLIIRDWNADAAIDNKARESQLVHLSISGPGHRPMRYWRSGPHYLVHANIKKPNPGTLLWFKDCSDTSVYIYKSTFNGLDRLTNDMIDCDKGSDPNIVYLTEDPRLNSQLHPMFKTCSE